MIITFDAETTGINPKKDQIIELCLQIGFDKNIEVKTWRIKPSVPISPSAQKVHGISLKDLEGCDDFKTSSTQFLDYFKKAEVIIGYNVEFDISFLQAELARNGLENLNLKDINIVDPLQIWRKCEPRNLSAAHQRFTGVALENAHSAEADVIGTADVLKGMIKQFDLATNSKELDWNSLAKLSGLSRNNWIGPSYHLQLKDQIVVIGFGKHKNRPLIDIAKSEDSSYLDWIVSKDDFPPHLKQILKDAPLTSEDSLQDWIKSNFK